MRRPVAKRAAKSRSGPSGPTLSQETRAARGYQNRTFSLPDAASELIDRMAAYYGTTRSAVVVMAIGLLRDGAARG
jgi:hypothetical protein